MQWSLCNALLWLWSRLSAVQPKILLSGILSYFVSFLTPSVLCGKVSKWDNSKAQWHLSFAVTWFSSCLRPGIPWLLLPWQEPYLTKTKMTPPFISPCFFSPKILPARTEKLYCMLRYTLKQLFFKDETKIKVLKFIRNKNHASTALVFPLIY